MSWLDRAISESKFWNALSSPKRECRNGRKCGGIRYLIALGKLLRPIQKRFFNRAPNGGKLVGSISRIRWPFSSICGQRLHSRSRGHSKLERNEKTMRHFSLPAPLFISLGYFLMPSFFTRVVRPLPFLLNSSQVPHFFALPEKLSEDRFSSLTLHDG